MRTNIFSSESTGKLDQNFYKVRFIGLLAFVVLNLFAFSYTKAIDDLYVVQGTLVSEDAENDAIPFAQVMFLQAGELKTGVVSDVDGRFSLSIKPGEYELVIKCIGYSELKRETVVERNIDLGIIKLKPLGVELEEVVVSEHRESLTKESYGGLDSRSADDPMIRGGRSDEAKTYVNGMPVKSKSKRSRSTGTAGEMFFDTRFAEPTAESIETSPGGESYGSGTLTAGELNDFNKFNAWTDLVKGELASYKKVWNMSTNQRFSVMLTNEEDGAVIDATVVLTDEKDNILWKTRSNNVGRAELWSGFSDESTKNGMSLKVTYDGTIYEAQKLVPPTKGVNYLQLPVHCFQPSTVDIAFVVDATGSMGDEINYLKAELHNVIEEVESQNDELTFNTASVFYKDVTDDYVTVRSNFSNNLDETISFIQDQQHSGGGDMPEAVDSALSEAVRELKWSENARARILFLVLDAPPHGDEVSIQRMKNAITIAAQKGIRIVPVICSGANKSNEYLMRTTSLATNGTYIFLTDHSGVGGSHIAPSTDEYEVTYLNDLMKDVINRFIEGTSCQNEPYYVDRDGPRLIDHVGENPDLRRNEPTEIKVPLELSNKVVSIQGEIDKIVSDAQNHFDKDLEESDFKTHISLFPNPTSDVLNIKLNEPKERVMLLDISGKLLREYSPGKTEQFSIALNEYPGGMYLIGFMKDDHLKTERFVLKK